MIGKLTGCIDNLSGNQLVIDVQGVGYVVSTSSRTQRKIGGVGEAASLLIETQVREDAINLFGFADIQERDWFRLLTTVQGVGAKVALGILSSLSPEELGQAIAAQDKTALSRADGVGPKLALRLVTELKDKALSFFTPTLSSDLASTNKNIPETDTSSALSALMNLGYRRIEAFAAVTSALQKVGPNSKLDDLIRASLTEISRKETV